MPEKWAVLCVCGALLVNLTLGTFYSIGNVGPYLVSYMRLTESVKSAVTSEAITWITATYLLGQALSIIAGSYVEQKFNNRVACIIGCIIHTASTYLTIFAINQNFTLVVLIFGFGSGLGCGFAYISSILAAQKWFPAHKGLFTGIIVAGFGFGGLVFTNLQTLYMNPKNSPTDSAGYYPEEVYTRLPNMFLYMAVTFTVVQTIGCALAFPPPKPTNQLNSSGSSSLNTQGNASNTTKNSGATTIVQDDILPDMKSFWSAFRYKVFYIIIIMCMLVAPGVTFVNSLGKRYGQIYIKGDKFLATINAMASVTNALGRLTWGAMADRFSFSVCYTVKVFMFSVYIITFPLNFVLRSEATYAIWILALFFGFSGTFVLFPVLCSQVFGEKYSGLTYGFVYIFLAISSNITSLALQFSKLGSHLEDKEGTLHVRIMPCIVIGGLYCLSFAIYFLALPVKRLEKAINRKKEQDLTQTRGSLFNRPDLYPLERGGTLAEKAAKKADGGSGLTKENSLGSIVKFAEPASNEPIKQFKQIGK